jgi:hypothetical protein
MASDTVHRIHSRTFEARGGVSETLGLRPVSGRAADGSLGHHGVVVRDVGAQGVAVTLAAVSRMRG